jgi:ABC-type lipoprotein export system ATPase subunit
MSKPIVVCEGLVHIYKSHTVEVVALQGLDLLVDPDEVVAVVGRSGSGKTTLMNILAGVEVPTAGSAMVAGKDLAAMDEAERDLYRRTVVGYTLQHSQANLAADLSSLENVMSPMHYGSAADRHLRAVDLLRAMGIDKLADRVPGQLSGGEAQRLAIAIALANEPKLLLADEPTAELDETTSDRLLSDLQVVLQDRGTAAIFVTHDTQVQKHTNRVVEIRDGKTSTETRWREVGDGYVADQVLIMDRAGRLQLPKSIVEKLKLGGRVRAHVEGDEVRIRRVDEETNDS